MIVHECDQRSEEWFALRLGRATASRAGDIIATGRGGKGVGAAQLRYRNELVVEQLNGVSAERPWSGNRHTDRGITLEEEAISLYEARHGIMVMPVGFIESDDYMAGCSPDGVIYGAFPKIDSVIEVKCPIQAIHYETLRQQEILDKAYKAQLLHSVSIAHATHGLFLSYCPQFAAPDDLVALDYIYSPTEIGVYYGQLKAFLATVDVEVQSRKPVTQQLAESLDG